MEAGFSSIQLRAERMFALKFVTRKELKSLSKSETEDERMLTVLRFIQSFRDVIPFRYWSMVNTFIEVHLLEHLCQVCVIGAVSEPSL